MTPPWGADRDARVRTLAEMLRHPDPAQLLFQVSEIAGELTYTRHGVTVQRGDVVLDVGANVGVAAAFFAQLCGASVVHSFEPAAPIFATLHQNVGHLPACVLHPYGLSSICRSASFTYYPRASAMSGLYADPDRDRELVRTVLLRRGVSPADAEEQLAERYEPQTLTCELRTLSSFLRAGGPDRIDLLKIDVERAELDVLHGIEERDWPRIRQVAMEVHDEDSRAATIIRLLGDRGFAVSRDREAAMAGTHIAMIYARRPER